MTTLFNTLTECLRRGELVALATMLTGPSAGRKLLIRPDGTSQGSLGSADLEAQVRAFAARPLQTQHPARRTFRVGGQAIDVFVDVYPPPPKLIIIGAVHIAMPLVTFGNELGFYTIVIDARATFAAPERFPHAGELIVRWPADALSELTLDEATCVVFLSHDEKLDNPALAVALNSPARYIGALGAEKTHRRRIAALQEMGFGPAQLARIHAPIGLNLGAQRPEEIAVSIIAQIVAAGRGEETQVFK